MQRTARKYYHAAAIVIFYIFHVIDKIIYVVNSDRIDAYTLKMHIYIRFLMEMHKDETNTQVQFSLSSMNFTVHLTEITKKRIFHQSK